MSKKFKNSLETLSADQVTEKLGNWCEKMGSTMTDQDKGLTRTFFSAAKLARKEHCNILLEVAAVKNGIDLNGKDFKGKDFETVLAAVATAVEKRGGTSAANVREYVDLVTKAKKAASDKGYKKTKNPIKAIKDTKMALKEFKNLGR